jgi:hypothetical protein
MKRVAQQIGQRIGGQSTSSEPSEEPAVVVSFDKRLHIGFIVGLVNISSSKCADSLQM